MIIAHENNKWMIKNWFSENEKQIILSFNHHSDILGKKQVSQIFQSVQNAQNLYC